MLKGFFRANPHHYQSLKVFGSEKSRIDALIFPLNSPVREVMKMATARMFENSAVDYLLQKWEGKNIPQVKGMCEYSTACGYRMVDRKRKEGKQQPSMLLGSAVPGSSLVSFYFLWAILCPQAVQCA